MPLQALYRKWRPRSFDEVVGQEHIIRTLRNAIASGRIHHAYLFSGPRGTGKTTTARLLAKAVNCLAPEDQRPCNECAICEALNEGRLLDLIEIDAASNTGVDDVRELRERVSFRPNEARYKVYVIDEVHMLSNAAFNALLKTLEEPPPHALFVLATTESHKVPATVLSRCQRFDFRRVPLDAIVGRLRWMTEQEDIRADDDALELIARQATGSMRDAESLLDQLSSYDEGGITAEEVRAALGIGASETVMQLVDAVIAGDVAAGLGVINTAIDEGVDPRRFAGQIVEHLRALLLLRLDSDVVSGYVSEEARPRLEAQATGFSPTGLARIVRIFNRTVSERSGGWQPQLLLEMALVDAVLPPEPESGASRTLGARGEARSPLAAPAWAPPSSQARVPAPDRSVTRSEAPAGAASTKVAEPAPVYDDVRPVEGPLTPELLRSHWTELLTALRRRNLPLEALMRSSEPIAVEGDVVVLGFEFDLHRARMEEEANKRDVEDVLARLAGRPCQVRCVLSKGRNPTSSRSPAHWPAAERQIGTPASASFDDDPLVKAAIELGAQVIRRPD